MQDFSFSAKLPTITRAQGSDGRVSGMVHPCCYQSGGMRPILVPTGCQDDGEADADRDLAQMAGAIPYRVVPTKICRSPLLRQLSAPRFCASAISGSSARLMCSSELPFPDLFLYNHNLFVQLSHELKTHFTIWSGIISSFTLHTLAPIPLLRTRGTRPTIPVRDD